MTSNIETLRAWIAIASKDLASAKKLVTPPDPQWETAVYHCQQTVEKALKAVLVLHGENPPKTHDVGLLLGKVGKFSNEFSDLEMVAEQLTDYATKYRYQDFSDDPLVEDVVEKAISDADTFLNRAKNLVDAYASIVGNLMEASVTAEVCTRCNQVPCKCGGSKDAPPQSRPRFQ